MGSEHNSITDEIGPEFPFKATPKAAPPTLKIDHDCGVKITTVSTVSVMVTLPGQMLIYSSLPQLITLHCPPMALVTRPSRTGS